jgi:hypothetical protein
MGSRTIVRGTEATCSAALVSSSGDIPFGPARLTIPSQPFPLGFHPRHPQN